MRDGLQSISTRAGTLALLSAAAATTHEVVWARLLGGVVGNTAWGIGLALAVFMIGMGVGSLLARRALERDIRPQRAYALTEALIGIGALAADVALLRLGPPSRFLFTGGWQALAFDVSYAAMATMIPALAMGAAYPLLTAAVTLESRERTAVTALYGSGLAGGVIGVLGAAFFLAPRIGFDGAAAAAALLNLTIAGLATRWLRTGSPARIEDPAVRQQRRDTDPAAGRARIQPAGLWPAALQFTAAGSIGLGGQVVWNRVVVCYAGVSTFSFAWIIAVYLLSQYLGFAANRRLDDRRAARLAGWSIAVAAPLALVSLAPLALAASHIPDRTTSPAGWLLGCGLAVAVAIGPACVLLGAAQAGALRLVETSRQEPSTAAAWVCGVGTIGAALVAAAVSLVLLPRLGPRGSLALLGGIGGAAMFAMARPRMGLVAAAAAALALAWRPGPENLLGPVYDDAPVLYAETGIQDTTAIIAVDLPVEPRIRRLVANGMSYSGDSLFAQRYMRLLGHLPALAARGEKRALVICIGTGSTASALLPYRYTAIDAVDISPSIRRTLGWFSHVNLEVDRDPRVHVIVEDGDRFLRLGRGESYDVITLEPPPPRAPGASALYSREFYRAARSRLAPGGVLAQWLPLHDLSDWEAKAIVATFLDVFPDATLHVAERNEAILLGGSDGSHLTSSATDRLARDVVQRDLARIGMDRMRPLEETLALDAAGLKRLAADAPLLRFAWPAPELHPLAAPRVDHTIDAFADEIALQPRANGPATTATIMLPMTGPFIRVTTGRGDDNDRQIVTAGLLQLLRRAPDNPYTQYMLGYGDHLLGRLDRLRSEGLTAAKADSVRALVRSQRDWAER